MPYLYGNKLHALSLISEIVLNIEVRIFICIYQCYVQFMYIAYPRNKLCLVIAT